MIKGQTSGKRAHPSGDFSGKTLRRHGARSPGAIEHIESLGIGRVGEKRKQTPRLYSGLGGKTRRRSQRNVSEG
jgi:hypothetical protein